DGSTTAITPPHRTAGTGPQTTDGVVPLSARRGPVSTAGARATDQMWRPPAISCTVPDMYEDMSEARNSTTDATSDGSPARPIGISASFESMTSWRIAAVISVLMKPGWIALTRTFLKPTSFAAAFVMPTMPAFAAE